MQSACSNCAATVEPDARYCRICGQKQPTRRIDWHFLVHEVQHGIFHVDRGILLTLRELFTRPGHMIREYLEGRRAPHMKPLGLVVILTALHVFVLNTLAGVEMMENSGLRVTADESSQIPAWVGEVLESTRMAFAWLGTHWLWVTLASIPLTALVQRWLFRNYAPRLNVPEWLTVVSFFPPGKAWWSRH